MKTYKLLKISFYKKLLLIFFVCFALFLIGDKAFAAGTATLTADKSAVFYGDPITISWTSQGVSRCDIYPAPIPLNTWGNNVPLNGSKTFSVTAQEYSGFVYGPWSNLTLVCDFNFVIVPITILVLPPNFSISGSLDYDPQLLWAVAFSGFFLKQC